MINSLIGGVVSASGDNTIIAAPGAGKKIAIHSLHVVNEGASAVTVIIRADAATTEVFRAHLAVGAAFTWTGTDGDVWYLTENKLLEINLSDAVDVGYTFRYRIR